MTLLLHSLLSTYDAGIRVKFKTISATPTQWIIVALLMYLIVSTVTPAMNSSNQERKVILMLMVFVLRRLRFESSDKRALRKPRFCDLKE